MRNLAKPLLVAILVCATLPASITKVYGASSSSKSASTSTFSSAATSVSAEVSTTEIRVRTKELLQRKGPLSAADRATLMSEFKNLTKQQICARRQLNLSARIEYYRVKHRDYAAAIEQLHLNSQKASTRLAELGYDTAKLDDLIKDLEDYLFAVKSDYFDLIDNLEDNLTKTCFDNFDQINTVGEAVKILKETRANVKNVDDQVLKILNAIKEIKKK